MEPYGKYAMAIMSQATRNADYVAWKVQRLDREDSKPISGHKRPASFGSDDIVQPLSKDGSRVAVPAHGLAVGRCL